MPFKLNTSTGRMEFFTADPSEAVPTHDMLSGITPDQHHPQLHAVEHVTGGDDVVADVIAAGNAGLMTGADKTKLNGIEAGATDDQTEGEILNLLNTSLEFGDLVSEQNPDGYDAIRLKGTVSDVGVVIGNGAGYFLVWNAADDTAVFYVNNLGDTDIAGDLTVPTGNIILGGTLVTASAAELNILDGLDLATTVGDPGSDTTLVSEQGIREALDAAGGVAFATAAVLGTL